MYAFDRRLASLLHYRITYAGCHRQLIIECAVYTLYYIAATALKLIYSERKFTLAQRIFAQCCNIEVILFGCAMFHMKNCAMHLRQRFDILHNELIAVYSEMSVRNHRATTINRFYRLIELYAMLNRVQKRLQSAFGAILLFICVYDMFTVTFSMYHAVYMNFRAIQTVSTRVRRQFVMVNFIMYGLPMIFKDVYLIVFFHRLGDRVSVKFAANVFLFINVFD